MERITEQPSLHSGLEHKAVDELVRLINAEDKKVACAIEEALPAISGLITAVVDALQSGGRMFYIGAGSGGRLSVLDVIELPTTYGIDKGVVNVILAGGVDRLIEALEEREDDREEGWRELQKHSVSPADIVIGISASGTTPFVLAALTACRKAGVATGCVVSNPGSPIAEQSDYPVEVITGPEFVTGSTRMKCGTAQKMIFDMISTTAMIRMGRVEGNSMVHVALINDKIKDRAVRMLMEKVGLTDYNVASNILETHGGVKAAQDAISEKNTPLVTDANQI